MKITLQQLYDDTKDKFKLSLLAGKDGMNNEVIRLYYMEDIMISNWTRQGELIVTTAMMSQKDDSWLSKFIDSLIIYKPSGIIINMGGYIDTIPGEIIDYCNKIKLPLLIFPWEVFLQDLQQYITNRIFEIEQRESNISNAFLNAIFTPENPEKYASCLEQNGYDKYDGFAVAVISSKDNIFTEKWSQLLQHMSCKIIFIKREVDVIIVFCGETTEMIENDFFFFYDDSAQFIKKDKLRIGIGNIVKNYAQVCNSYKKAKDCILFGKKKRQHVTIFEQMGIESLLMTCDRDLMQIVVQKKLGSIMEYDKDNQTDYLETLRTFVKLGGNTVETARQLYVHRNTINYRMKRIKEMIGTDFSQMKDIVEYQIAFYILDLC